MPAKREPREPNQSIEGLGFGVSSKGADPSEPEARASEEREPAAADLEAPLGDLPEPEWPVDGGAFHDGAFPEEQGTRELAMEPMGAETHRPPGPGLPALTFPPAEATTAAEEVVLDEIAANATERTRTSQPPPLGYAEGHDAWTVERMSRQSTVPPQAGEDMSRLRELSARRISDLPGQGELSGDAARGGALDLIDHSQPSEQLDLLGEMEELYALDDLTGALRFAELILGREPGNLQAQRCADNCRARLIRLYSSKLGDMDAPVMLALEDAELRWLGLDHRSGFLLSRVDGMSTVEELLDICGMPRLEGLKTLVELLERGAIRIH